MKKILFITMLSMSFLGISKATALDDYPCVECFQDSGCLQRYDMLAQRDKVLDNAETRNSFARFPREPEIIEYPDSEHTLFFGASKDKVASDIIDFIRPLATMQK